MPASASRSGDHIALDCPFREKDRAKMIGGARWDRDTQTWRIPLSWAAVWQLRGVFGPSLEVDDALREWAADEFRDRVMPAQTLRTAHDAPGDPRLYPFQRAGVAFLRQGERVILADEMGLGKTVQAIMALEREDLPVLVVCPNSMKRVWERELHTWAPDLRVLLSHTSGQGAAARRKAITAVAAGEADVLVINWESLRYHTRLSGYGNLALTEAEKAPKELNDVRWGTIIADEAHRAKDPRSKQTRALWAVAHQQPCRRYALTGTPIANAPDDAWSLLHFIAPEEWPSRTRFIDRYCLTGWSPFGGLDVIGLRPATQDEFFTIVDPRFIRRPKAAVLPELPPKVYSTRYVEMTAKQRTAYRSLVKEMLAELDTGLAIVADPLVRALRLMQLASAYAEQDEAGDWHLSEPSSKLDDFMDLFEELDGPAVVFAESRQLIELLERRLAKAGVSYGAVHGKISTDDRDRDVAAFQAGKLPLLLVTLGAGGEGLTLHAASTAVFLQRSWSMVKNLQAEDRAHRIGQNQSLHVVSLISADTLEEYQLEGLANKEARLEELVRDAETLRRMLGKE